MALITIAETAIRSGFGVELMESLLKKCPKPGESRVLPSAKVDGVPYIREEDLDAYRDYLSEPWPKPPSGKRPNVPKVIADDVRAESHHGCAICGAMDNGELAHIDPAAVTLNNSPDNLVLLCPTHHTEYDYGYKPSSNLDRETILAAKRMKRASHRRMLQYEGNVAGALRVVLQAVTKMEADLSAEEDEIRRQTYTTELEALIRAIPRLSSAAQEAAAKDRAFAESEAALVEVAPRLIRLIEGTTRESESETAARNTAKLVVGASRVVIDLDEVDCPHCGGRGTTGLMGDLCSYCRGSQVVSEAKAAEYDPDAIDEVDCPHCGGRGTVGLFGDMCSYCRGSQVVSEAKAAEYDPDAIDEVDCPRCGGRGTTGLVGDPCGLCRGRTVVPRSVEREYRSSRG